ncbi:MAG: WecB/TagA/CpsF family glycosyl transferase [Chloroflexota bacterium]|nr:glycosyltransferase [Chloroflexota bacterium]NOG65224.1 WecB/TagA/CpsF family glycosyltransferase [Chloroflexota bacterium]GIK66612.1 MAG: WecB/TagA/CpsF family glycosyl transferase [Chloroflexota bacterium]
MTPSERLRILGVPIDAHTFETWLAQVETWVNETDGLHHICTVNPEFVMIAQQHPAFYQVLQKADVCLADGSGILLAARWLGQALPQRVTGTDSLPKLAELAAQKGWHLFFLGAAPGVAELAAEKLRADYAGLQITVNPANPDEADTSIKAINQSGASILLVAYGAPMQDLWIDQHRDHLPNIKIAMGVGGAFDFVAGIVPRAPKWMQELYLEWLYRLIRQPWRWKRMLRLPLFVITVLRYRRQPTPKLVREMQ